MLRVSPDQGSDVYLLRKMVEEVFDVLYSKNLHASIWGFGLPPGLAELPGATAGCGFRPQPSSPAREQAPGRAAWRDALLRRVSVASRWDLATTLPLSSAPNWAKKKIPMLGGASSAPPAREVCHALSAIFKRTFILDTATIAPLSQVLCRSSAETHPFPWQVYLKGKKMIFLAGGPAAPAPRDELVPFQHMHHPRQ